MKWILRLDFCSLCVDCALWTLATPGTQLNILTRISRATGKRIPLRLMTTSSIVQRARTRLAHPIGTHFATVMGTRKRLRPQSIRSRRIFLPSMETMALAITENPEVIRAVTVTDHPTMIDTTLSGSPATTTSHVLLKATTGAINPPDLLLCPRLTAPRIIHSTSLLVPGLAARTVIMALVTRKPNLRISKACIVPLASAGTTCS